MSLSKYQGKDIIATISFNRNFGYEENSLIYVYPNFLVTKDGLERIDSDDFPTRGCFEARLYGGFTVQKILEGYGDVVTIRINGEPTTNIRGSNLYAFRFNPEFGKARSEIWIEEFKGLGLYQILSSYQPFSVIDKTRRLKDVSDFIYTNQILVQDNYKIYGPFDFKRDSNGKDLLLSALETNDYLVGEYSEFEIDDNIIDVKDQSSRSCAVLVPKDRIVSPEKKSHTYDWVSDQVIIDIFVDLMRSEYGYDEDLLEKVRALISKIGNTQEINNITISRLDKLKSLAKQATVNQLIFKNNLAAIFNNPSLESGMRQLLSLEQEKVDEANHKYEQVKKLATKVVDEQESFSSLFAKEAGVTVYDDLNELDKSKDVVKPKSLKDQLNNLFSREKLSHGSNSSGNLLDGLDSYQDSSANATDSVIGTPSKEFTKEFENSVLEKVDSISLDFLKIAELTEKNELLEQENKQLKDKDELYCNVEELKQEQLDLNQSVGELKKEVGDLEHQIAQKQKDNAIIESSFESKISEFQDRANIAAKIIDNQLYDRIVRSIGGLVGGANLAAAGQIGQVGQLANAGQAIEANNTSLESHGSQAKSHKKSATFNHALLEKSLSGKEIIQRVLDVIKNKAHRDVSYNDIANYLICLNQGFITTLAGEPGTGKTSLCILLAKALGLARSDSSRRFVEIAVERGWTSHKDFIGYYNPLTNNMEKSNVEAFNAFECMSEECGSKNAPYDEMEVAPYIVLLDEANLSPIEHYWAIFLKNCDLSSSSQREISIGGNRVFHLPQHLRFLATVNFDHTTEELSPRYLDRSWVIYLEPDTSDQIYDDDELVLNVENMIPYGSLTHAFGPKDNDTISEAVAAKWEIIKDIFAHKGAMPITPRNLKMVHNYCKVACRCMDLKGKESSLAPLDYALCQKILPSINGSGENYQALIDALAKECTEQSMPISAKHLMRMQRNAKNNMGFYQFFAR